MVTTERVALLLLAAVLGAWAVVELWLRHDGSEAQIPIIDTVVVERFDTVVVSKPAKSRSKKSGRPAVSDIDKSSKRSAEKASAGKASERQKKGHESLPKSHNEDQLGRDYLEESLTE